MEVRSGRELSRKNDNAPDPAEIDSHKTRRDSEPPSLAERAREYLERRQQREIQKQVEAEEELAKHVRERPQINKNSSRIAETNGRVDDVGSALYAHAELQRATRERLQEEERKVGSLLARPAITRLAAELVREGDVAERLYNEAANRNREFVALQELLEGKHQTNQGQHADVSYSNELYEKAMAGKLAKAQAEKEHIEHIKKLASKSKLSSNSRKIVESLEQTSSERLLRPRKLLPKESHKDGSLSFKPRINKKSERIMESREMLKGSTSESPKIGTAHERLYMESKTRESRRVALKASASTRDAEELAECTFKPNITPFCCSAETSPSNDKVEDRLFQWQARKEERIAIQKQASDSEDREKNQQCTFKPKINARRTKTEGRSRYSVEPHRGFDEFVARQRKAREEKKKAQQETSSLNWTNKVTVPIGPNLGTAKRHEERADKKSAARHEGSEPPRVRLRGHGSKRQPYVDPRVSPNQSRECHAPELPPTRPPPPVPQGNSDGGVSPREETHGSDEYRSEFASSFIFDGKGSNGTRRPADTLKDFHLLSSLLANQT